VLHCVSWDVNVFLSVNCFCVLLSLCVSGCSNVSVFFSVNCFSVLLSLCVSGCSNVSVFFSVGTFSGIGVARQDNKALDSQRVSIQRITYWSWAANSTNMCVVFSWIISWLKSLMRVSSFNLRVPGEFFQDLCYFCFAQNQVAQYNNLQGHSMCLYSFVTYLNFFLVLHYFCFVSCSVL